MSKALKGYTIVEVLLVLAISTTLLFAAIAVFKGQQGETQFTQAVADLNSKILNYASQVSAGTFPDSQAYDCTPGNNTPPTLTASGVNNLGGREGCLFLGSAIQVEAVPSSKIDVYTVIGNRETPAGDTASTIRDTNPTAATVSSGGPPVYVLNDTYTLAGNTQVTQVTGTETSGIVNNNWTLAGIYTDLNSGTASPTGNLQLDLFGYPAAPSVKTCIEGNGACALYSQLSHWDLCLANSTGSHKILLSVISNAGGLTTKQTDGGC